ncbi:MAG: L-threonylcarbamoyladenylate synthase [Lachnospiraceae bacterium]|nr:L-threonylcarbamoyladenylate synthase [Lachnospiraceae bacterium]
MKTKRIKIEDVRHPKDEELLEAAQILRNGGLVAFPTETVYGLGGNALDADASRKIYAAKGRPSDNPLIAHISCMEELAPLVKEIPEAGRVLAEKYWPGPLTMIFPKSDIVPYGTTGGLDTVAVRMPSDPVASRLICLAGVPVAAPSANTSGRPSPTTADHVWQDMNGKIEMVVDGGAVGIGVESTIVDVTGPVPVILRPGAITQEMLDELFGRVEIDPAILGPMKDGVRPKAPGMKYKHYAPKGDLTLVELKDETIEELYKPGSALYSRVSRMMTDSGKSWKLDPESFYMAWAVNEEAVRMEKTGARVGVICTEETMDEYTVAVKRSIGKRSSADSVAHNLYAVLRDFDDLGVDYIYSESFSDSDLGHAIMNRLNKAAGYHILKV